MITNDVDVLNISIHTPVKGVTNGSFFNAIDINFNPHSRKGSDSVFNQIGFCSV